VLNGKKSPIPVKRNRYIVCNGAEADPMVFKDRVLLEDDPHSILEGMIIAAYAT
jgi:NADH-quinone oxidoreductase subunit F